MFGDLYYVTFTVELIEKLAHDFIKDSKQHLTTEQHENPVKYIYMVVYGVDVNGELMSLEGEKLLTKDILNACQIFSLKK